MAKSIKKISNFQKAVESTPQINNAYSTGLRALGGYSNKIKLSNTQNCEGSVDIDSTVNHHYPTDNRWDYCLSYKGEVFFVEVHSANTGEVDTVIKKLSWLKNWLNREAPLINDLKAKSKHPFYWIQVNGFHILPNSRQFKSAIQENIKPVAQLVL